MERLQSGRTGRTYCLETKTFCGGYTPSRSRRRQRFFWGCATGHFWGVRGPVMGLRMYRAVNFPAPTSRRALSAFAYQAPRRLRERPELASGHVPGERHHPAVRTGVEALQTAHGESAFAQGRRDLLRPSRPGRSRRRSHRRARPCPSRSADELERDARVRAFERHLADRRAREQRKGLLVLPPLAAERLLPVDVGLDPVAVADVDGGSAGRGPARRARACPRPSRGLRRSKR